MLKKLDWIICEIKVEEILKNSSGHYLLYCLIKLISEKKCFILRNIERGAVHILKYVQIHLFLNGRKKFGFELDLFSCPYKLPILLTIRDLIHISIYVWNQSQFFQNIANEFLSGIFLRIHFIWSLLIFYSSNKFEILKDIRNTNLHLIFAHFSYVELRLD